MRPARSNRVEARAHLSPRRRRRPRSASVGAPTTLRVALRAVAGAALFAAGAALLAPSTVAAQAAAGAAGPTAPAPAFEGIPMRTIGPAVMSGRIVDLDVVESDASTFFAASATGGVWRTDDGGITWDPIFQNQGTHSMGDIVVHQANPDILYVGTGERASRQSSSWGDGVDRSTDGGTTWEGMLETLQRELSMLLPRLEGGG